MSEQYLTLLEIDEISRLLIRLNALEAVAPDNFSLYDSNGERLGEIKPTESVGEWAFYYPAPEE